MWQHWQRIIKEEAEKYGYGKEQEVRESATKAALEDFMYDLPKAAVAELQPVMKGTLRGGSLRDKVSSILKKHKVPTFFMGTSATQVVLDYFDTFFGESVEEQTAKDIQMKTRVKKQNSATEEAEKINEAYISTDEIKVIRQDLKKEFPAFRFAVSRQPNSYGSIRIYILSGPMKFSSASDGHINHYHPQNYNNADTLKKILAVINKKNHDNSDISTDYFDVGFYLDLVQGRGPAKPFVLTDKTGKKPVKAGEVVPTAEEVEAEEDALCENHECGCNGDKTAKKIQSRIKSYKQVVAQKIGEEVVRPTLKEVQRHMDSQMQPHAEARIGNTQHVFGVTDIEITEDGTVKSFKWNGEIVTEAKIKYLTGPGKRDSRRIIGIYTMQGKWIKDMNSEKEAMNFVNKSWGESVEEEEELVTEVQTPERAKEMKQILNAAYKKQQADLQKAFKAGADEGDPIINKIDREMRKLDKLNDQEIASKTKLFGKGGKIVKEEVELDEAWGGGFQSSADAHREVQAGLKRDFQRERAKTLSLMVQVIRGEISKQKFKKLTGSNFDDLMKTATYYINQIKRMPKSALTPVAKAKTEEVIEDGEVEEAYAHPDEKVLGSFYEKTGNKAFEYRMSKDSWGKSHGLPHEVCVSRKDYKSQGDWRAANVKGTVCYIAVDEGEGGKPVIEKWEIKRHVKYVKAEGVEQPLWKSIFEGAAEDAQRVAKSIVAKAKELGVQINVTGSTSVSFSKSFTAGSEGEFSKAYSDCNQVRNMVTFKNRQNQWGASGLGRQSDIKNGRVTIHKSGDGAAYLLKALDKMT
jgi:hypothetical protein